MNSQSVYLYYNVVQGYGCSTVNDQSPANFLSVAAPRRLFSTTQGLTVACNGATTQAGGCVNIEHVVDPSDTGVIPDPIPSGGASCTICRVDETASIINVNCFPTTEMDSECVSPAPMTSAVQTQYNSASNCLYGLTGGVNIASTSMFKLAITVPTTIAQPVLYISSDFGNFTTMALSDALVIVPPSGFKCSASTTNSVFSASHGFIGLYAQGTGAGNTGAGEWDVYISDRYPYMVSVMIFDNATITTTDQLASIYNTAPHDVGSGTSTGVARRSFKDKGHKISAVHAKKKHGNETLYRSHHGFIPTDLEGSLLSDEAIEFFGGNKKHSHSTGISTLHSRGLSQTWCKIALIASVIAIVLVVLAAVATSAAACSNPATVSICAYVIGLVGINGATSLIPMVSFVAVSITGIVCSLPTLGPYTLSLFNRDGAISKVADNVLIDTNNVPMVTTIKDVGVNGESIYHNIGSFKTYNIPTASTVLKIGSNSASSSACTAARLDVGTASYYYACSFSGTGLTTLSNPTSLNDATTVSSVISDALSLEHISYVGDSGLCNVLTSIYQVDPVAGQPAGMPSTDWAQYERLRCICYLASDTYGILPGGTWGTAPASVQTTWTQKGCDSVITGFNNEILGQDIAIQRNLVPGTAGYYDSAVMTKFSNIINLWYSLLNTDMMATFSYLIPSLEKDNVVIPMLDVSAESTALTIQQEIGYQSVLCQPCDSLNSNTVIARDVEPELALHRRALTDNVQWTFYSTLCRYDIVHLSFFTLADPSAKNAAATGTLPNGGIPTYGVVFDVTGNNAMQRPLAFTSDPGNGFSRLKQSIAIVHNLPPGSPRVADIASQCTEVANYVEAHSHFEDDCNRVSEINTRHIIAERIVPPGDPDYNNRDRYRFYSEVVNKGKGPIPFVPGGKQLISCKFNPIKTNPYRTVLGKGCYSAATLSDAKKDRTIGKRLGNNDVRNNAQSALNYLTLIAIKIADLVPTRRFG
ncbi:hypothetical protein HDU86_007571 [Geranomyces michiganensis]|nr:hypothetical protein HDU86_007571 [Geranomyces michiganensis]